MRRTTLLRTHQEIAPVLTEKSDAAAVVQKGAAIEDPNASGCGWGAPPRADGPNPSSRRENTLGSFGMPPTLSPLRFKNLFGVSSARL
jgi:hypothetical protein